MSAQEGILLALFIIIMLIRNSQGIAANKVFFLIKKDLRFTKDGRIYFHDFSGDIFLHLLHVYPVLCHVDRTNFLYCSHYI